MSRNLPPTPPTAHLDEPYRDQPDQLPRPSSSELRDYWDDGPLPPPHRLDDNFHINSSTESFHSNNNNSSRSNRLDDPFDPRISQEIGHQYPTGSNTAMNRFSAHGGYGNLDNTAGNTDSFWLAQEKKKNRRSKLLIFGGVAGVLLLVIIGVIVGVVVGMKKSSSSKAASSSSSGNSDSTKPGSTPSSAGTADPSTGFFAVVQQSDPKDPSTFIKDPSLQNSFYGVAYTPYGSQIPSCGANLQAVTEDIQLISQITTRLRLYGADCNQASLVLEAIKNTKVNLSVWLGNYVLPDDDAGYTRQRDEITDAIKKFGADNVAGITVGNEFMLNYLNAHGNGVMDPNSDIANTGAQILNAKIADTRSNLASLSLSKTIPVGTSDAGAFFNNEVLASVDYGMANVHPWFANVSVDQAAGWTTQFFQQTDIAQANAQPNKPQMYIAETGWPTQSNDAGNESNGASTASVPNLQTFINTFTCQANTAGINYFFFEVFDEPWKNATFGGVEGYWGVFNFNKTLKAGLSLPSCSHS